MGSKGFNKNSERLVRDISWLSFNERVLQEAQDESVALHDRLKFLGIYSSNMDEFFRVRVATLIRMASYNKISRIYLEDKPNLILEQIQARVLKNQTRFNTIFNSIIKELKTTGVVLINEKRLNAADKKWIRHYFNTKVRSNIVPLMLESIPQAPNLKDKSIYLACILTDNNKGLKRYALIEVPTNICGRFIIVPTEGKKSRIILLEDIIRFCLPNLFSQFGFEKFESYIIKLTRDGELDLDNDIDTDFIKSIEKGLRKRKSAKALRFVYDKNINEDLLKYLSSILGLSKRDHFIPGGRIHNHKDFMSFPKSVFHESGLERRQIIHPLLKQPIRIMKVLDQRDVMLHLPFHSFGSIIDLLREAAIDPEVIDIKISCYRLADKSKIVNALINAIQNGKRVTAVIELRARFNEKENLEWKQVLEQAGAKVLIGQPHIKIHAKVCVITKKIKNRYKRYSFVSTGNINENTSKLYGDHYLLTSHRGIGDEINRLFQYIEYPKRRSILTKFKHIITSPNGTRAHFIDKIEQEIEKGKKGKIIIKLNSCSDDELISKLELAASKGVKVKLIIRGISRVITKGDGWKQSIEAISIVDEYLEHSRIMYFKHADEYYISSSDWMKRNLDHRIEVTVPIYDTVLKEELKNYLNLQLKDNVKARILDSAQKNLYKKKGRKKEAIRSQELILDFLLAQKY